MKWFKIFATSLCIALQFSCGENIRDSQPTAGRTAIVFEFDSSMNADKADLLEQFARGTNGDKAHQEISFQTAKGIRGSTVFRATRVSESFDEVTFRTNLSAWKEIHGIHSFTVEILQGPRRLQGYSS